MARLLQLKSGLGSVLTLANGFTATGYDLLGDVTFGDVVRTRSFSGQRGGLGARPATSGVENKSMRFAVRVSGSTQDAMIGRAVDLARIVQEIERTSGVAVWRSATATYRVTMQAFVAAMASSEWGNRAETINRAVFAVEVIGAPYWEGDPLDVYDPFDVDSIAAGDWTRDAGTAMTVGGGLLAPANTSVVQMRYTAGGYTLQDAQATLRITTGAAVTNLDHVVAVCMDTAGADTMIGARVVGGATNQVQVVKRVAGVQTVLGTPQAFAPAVNSTFFLRCRRQGDQVFAEVYTVPTTVSYYDAGLSNTPTQVASTVLTADDAALIRKGHGGFRLIPHATTERYDEFRFEPWTYLVGASPTNRQTPEVLELCGGLPGSAPLRCDIDSYVATGGALTLNWALFGWWRQPLPFNAAWNGGGELGTTAGWSVAVVAGVLANAGSSVATDTTAARVKYGGFDLQVVCPATANSGMTFRIGRRPTAGKAYLALFWASSAAGTTLARIRLGRNGDIASSAAVALAATQKLYSAVWQPTTSPDGFYHAVAEITAATGTTWNVDGLVVVPECAITTLSADPGGAGTTLTFRSIPDEWRNYPLPFTMLVEPAVAGNELVQVTALDYVAKTATVVRGVEGSTAGAHAASSIVAPLPIRRQHLEGQGAAPVFGVLGGAGVSATGSTPAGSLWVDDAAGWGGIRQRKSTIAAGAGDTYAEWIVDPSLTVPDDYTLGQVMIEVYAKIEADVGLVTPTLVVSAVSTLTQRRYTDEFGSTGVPIVKPTAASHLRLVPCGTLTLPVDRLNPALWTIRADYVWQAGTIASNVALNYLLLVPAATRALMKEGVAADASWTPFYSASSSMVRRVRSDLAGLIRQQGAQAFFAQDQTMLGQTIEPAYSAGGYELVLHPSTMIPLDPTINNNDETGQTAGLGVRVAGVPRFDTLRDV